MRSTEVYDLLTDREREVLVFAGLPYSLAAEELDISRRTVEAHMRNIAEKIPDHIKGDDCTPGLAVAILRSMLGIQTPDLDSLNAEIPERLQRRGPYQSQRAGFVYFIRTLEPPNRVKIGLSYNPDDRFESIRTASPLALELMGYVDGGMVLEEALHRQFCHLRLHGEWFALAPDLAAALDDILRGRPE